MKKVLLNNNGIEKIKSKNLWIYNREIKQIKGDIKPGDLVEITTSSGKFLGIGYINPKSKITVRVLSFEEVSIDKNFFKDRIEKAYRLREPLFSKTNAFRVIHAEADFLPGFIADYYNGYLSIQINTAGMENFREYILQALIDILSPKGIVEKSDKTSREIEGLHTQERVLYGNVPEHLIIEENGIKFKVNLINSQKTGFYLDQRANREKISNYVKEGFEVLDLFSNTGGFGIYTASKGADFVKFVDISPSAVSLIEENIKINRYKEFSVVKSDVFDFLKEELKSANKYNLIILDPPPFAKSRNEREGALKGFKYLILNSLKLLEKDGYLAVFSCSHHISHQDLVEITFEALKDTGFTTRYVQFMSQDIDHPYILNIPNSFYLKGFLIQKIG